MVFELSTNGSMAGKRGVLELFKEWFCDRSKSSPGAVFASGYLTVFNDRINFMI